MPDGEPYCSALLVLSDRACISTCRGARLWAIHFPKCSAADAQFAGGFQPPSGTGGFGGGACTATKTPVIFIHGNADRAISWNSPAGPSGGRRLRTPRSVYDELKNRGYRDCELFGVTYLDGNEQEHPAGNYHRPEKYRIITNFIDAVKAHTGSQRIDLVTHSLGVTMTLAALKVHDAWGSVRRFVNIAGAVRGLDACLYMGPANPLAPTCGSESFADHDVFGLYPGYNVWTGSGTQYSLREMPGHHPGVDFYTLYAGVNDQIHCTAGSSFPSCARGPIFETAANVKSQLNIGDGSTARIDSRAGHGDGVGHFRVRNNAGSIIYTMLSTNCRGLNCKGNYSGAVRQAP